MQKAELKNLFETEYGSFSTGGDEYIIKTPGTPKPWINVISNGDYGLVTSQAGGGFSFKTHSEFNRITRWHQDMVKDDWGKYIYVKNDLTGEVFSPTWMPVKNDLDFFECRHGLGYSIWTSEFKGIGIVLTLFIPFGESLEIWDVKVKNNTGGRTELSFFNYFEWCLGSSADFHREFHRTFIETRFERKLNAIVAEKKLWDIPLPGRGHWNNGYPFKGFFSSSRDAVSFECDKEMFLGMYGSLQMPKEVTEGSLSGSSGSSYDPVACLHIKVSLDEGDSERFQYFLGLSEKEKDIKNVLGRYRADKKVDEALLNVKKIWNDLLSPLSIDTPDEAMNILVNRWLPYQAISGRLWARTAYYQQSGAIGFRDQLQDSLVFLPLRPELTKSQILLHARHQKRDGTVLHWWHPITETGLETNMTDDLLWLPFVIIHYIGETDDYSILKIKEPFFDDKKTSKSLLEHSIRATDRTLKRMSRRGLPLIGAGDWNDGLNAVGLDWKGESFWLSEFLYYILVNFSELLSSRGKKKKSSEYKKRAKKLQKAFEKHAWDGQWFLRATKDSGEKIGSSKNTEGRIYLNAQSWAVISGITSEERKTRAMDAAQKYLNKDFGPLLLHPAYSKPDKFIGYLSRYAKGKRENGGVYMHAAAWSIWALSLLGRSDEAYEVFRRICPVYNGMNAGRYGAEPYVTPGNIDGPESAFYGRGGWTWYTGSAQWLQKVIVERILGIRAEKGGLLISPCIPKEWDGYSLRRTFRGTVYNIKVLNPLHTSGKVQSLYVDGRPYEGNIIMPQKAEEVNVEVTLGG